MKETIKIIYFLCIILGNQFAFAQEKELFKKSTERTPQQKEENIKADYTEKKKFNEDTYNELKKEVELVEEIAKKKMRSDSSEFGRGYGVEYGKDYVVSEYDSVTGAENVFEKNRRSGQHFKDDGIRRGNRNSNPYIRNSTKRRENISSRGKIRKLSERTQEKTRKNKQKSKEEKNGNLGSFFLILFLAIAVGGIIYLIFIKPPLQVSSRKIFYEKEFDPSKIQLSELEIQINEAEKNKAFRTATRYYFIWVIKELTDRNYIVWKKKKTNYHYISEVSTNKFAEKFSKTVSIFEYVWYGKYEIKKNEYTSVKKEFISLIKTLKHQDKK